VDVLMFDEGAAPPGLRARVVALQRAVSPGITRDITLVTHDQSLQPVTMALVDDGNVVASLDVLSKDLVHAGEAYRASGLSWVMTHPELRHRGYGRRLVAAARAHIEASGADLALFTCDSPLRSFYAGAGWELLQGTVLVGGTPADPFPSDQPGFDKVTFGGFFTARAKKHRDDFVGARIDLYPGPIDKLW
jgi:GNAT superfamily N-acetyltransferase